MDVDVDVGMSVPETATDEKSPYSDNADESLFVDKTSDIDSIKSTDASNGNADIGDQLVPSGNSNEKTQDNITEPVLDLVLPGQTLEDVDLPFAALDIDGSPKYPWAEAAKNDDEKSIAILEEAVQDAILTGKKFVEEIHSIAKNSDSLTLAWFPQWRKDFRKICRDQDNFSVKVGVSGSTGVGKTAIINSLLGYDGLLPSSAEEAATGTVCAIHLNTSPKPAQRFRANVCFKRRDEMKKWLDAFFKELRAANATEDHTEGARGKPRDLRKPEADETGSDVGIYDGDVVSDDTDYDDDLGSGHGEHDGGGIDLSEYLKPIYDVWGLEEHDLLTMDSEAVLESNAKVKGLLSNGKVTVTSQCMEDFSDMIKPFLDSTSLQDSAFGYEQEGTKVWLLVDHVDIYVKSAILENGIVLEDLPGVGDATDLRGKVAEDHVHQLDVTIIVTAIERAADNKATSELISNNQALRMQLDGKFNKRQFCIATSKIDKLDWENYLNRELKSASTTRIREEYDRYKTTRNDLKELKSRLRQAKKDQEKAQEDLNTITSRDVDQRSMRQAVTELSNAKVIVDELKDLQERYKERLDFLDGLMSFLCSSARNERVKTRIQKMVRQCKSSFRRNAGDSFAETMVDDTIDVFPVSSTAFWRLNDFDATPAAGFPQPNYTGVPALKTWIRLASIPARKEHAKRLLSKLNILLNVLLTWTDDAIIGVGSVARPEVVLRGTLEPFTETLLKNLKNNCGENLVKNVQSCNPLRIVHGDKKRFHPKSRSDVLAMVSRWNMLEPRKLRNKTKIHCATHAAIVRRGGIRYKSRGRVKVEYAWIDDMADRILIEVAEKWTESFHRRLPEKARKVDGIINEAWETSLNKVRLVLPKHFPNDLVYLQGQLDLIHQIRESVTKDIEQAMFAVARDAQDIHPGVKLTLAHGWQNVFDRASVMSGRKVLQRRQEMFKRHAGKYTTPYISKSLQDMENAINRSIEGFKASLGDIWLDGLNKINQQIETLLCSIAEKHESGSHPPTTDNGEHAIIDMLKKMATPHIISWRENWNASGTSALMQEEAMATDVPVDYIPQPDDAVLDEESEPEPDSDPDPEPVPKKQRTAKGTAAKKSTGKVAPKKTVAKKPAAKKADKPACNRGAAKAPRRRKSPVKAKLEAE